MLGIKSKAFAIKLAIILVFASLVGVLVACTNNNRDNEIQAWFYLVEDSNAHKELKNIAEEYNKKTEGPKVVLKNFISTSALDTAVKSDVPVGKAPDLFFHFANEANDYIKGGYVLRLDGEEDHQFKISELVKDTGGSNADGTPVNPGLKEALSQGGTYNGQLWSLPLHGSGPMMYFNKEIFDSQKLALPKSWGELEEAGKVIKEKLNIPVFSPSTPIDFYQELIIQSGSGYIKEDADGKFVADFDKEKLKNIFSYIRRNMTAGIFKFAEEFTGLLSRNLIDGNVASYHGSNSHESDMVGKDKETTADKIGFKLAVDAAAQGGVLSDEKGGVATDGTKWSPSFNRQIIAFKSNDVRQKATLAFMKHFTNAQNSAAWSAANTVLSPYTAARDQDVFKEALDKSHAMQAALNALAYSDSAKLTAKGGKTNVRNIITGAFKLAVSQDSQNPDFDKIIDDLIKDLNAELAK